MSVAEEPQAIEITNLGPIPRLTLPILPGGGVVLALGPNGSGKTHAVKAVQALYDSSVRPGLSHTDGTPNGTIAGPGLTIRLGKVNTKRGELEVEAIDSECDPSKLVDPGIVDPVAADRDRLRRLTRMRRVQVSDEAWQELLAKAPGGGIAAESVLIDGFDAVAQAAQIKKRLNDEALTLEKDGKAKESKANGLREAVKDVPKTAPACDGSAEDWSDKIADAKRKRAARAEAMERAEASKAKLAELGDGLSVQDAADRYNAASNEATDTAATVAELEEQLDEARRIHEAKRADLHRAHDALQAAERHYRLRKESLAAIESVVPDAPSDEELAELEARKVAANEAEKTAQRVAEAAAQRAKADATYEEARQALNAAEDLRTLAKRTDDILAAALASAGLQGVQVHDGRLCVATDRGPRELFADLSQGEKWKFAIEQSAAGFDAANDRMRLLPVCQEAWEGLDPTNRRLVDLLAKQHRVTIYSAQAADGELRAEEYAG
jgi:hypothetical protein